MHTLLATKAKGTMEQPQLDTSLFLRYVSAVTFCPLLPSFLSSSFSALLPFFSCVWGRCRFRFVAPEMASTEPAAADPVVAEAAEGAGAPGELGTK